MGLTLFQFSLDEKESHMSDSRLFWVDYARGLGIILVVYGHVLSGIYNADLGISPSFYVFTHNVIYSFHMPLFFFLSGLFVHQSLVKRGVQKFFVDKARFILYPYLIWSLLKGGIKIALLNFTNESAELSDLLAIWYLPLGHFWFLYVLVLMYIVYAVSLQIRMFYLQMLVVASLVLFFFPIDLKIASLDQFSANFLFFVFGVIYQKYSLDKLVNKKSFLYASVLIPCLFLTGAIFTFSKLNGLYSLHPAMVLPLSLMGIAAVVYISKYLAEKETLRVIKIFGFYSLAIYLAHTIFGSGIRIIMDKFMGLQNIGIHILAGMLVGIIVPVFLYQFSMKWNFPYLFELRRRLPKTSPTN